MKALRKIGYSSEIRNLNAGSGQMKLRIIHRYEKNGVIASFARLLEGLMGLVGLK